MLVKCPTCKKQTEFSSQNKYRPFCCERCSILDLGAWAEEKYRVPVGGQESGSVNENQDDEPTSESENDPKHQLN